MKGNTLTPDTLLDAALMLAADRHWEAVRLYDVARHLNISLAEVHELISEKENLIDLLWDRADAHMLATCRGTEFDALDFPAQYEQCVMSWLACLAPHRRTVRQMLQVRLEPGHLHIQLPTLLRISRTVQWMRELCGREATFLKRASEEIALSTIFVTSAAGWINDDSEDARRTRHNLAFAIRQAVRLGRLWPDSTVDNSSDNR
ncbi:TetR/AcrR family transcriptional regulator [Nitrincola alkalilacustris]|uniref:TetR/AcrR family transcriptional regulator n=1 Tax=Nitrincola alkalilacustris TaxID=1571224 RepID=UPI001456B571|nr:TetR/AcrR family transcriptional regulator [Nitrincola alkalilacustris]